MPRWGGWTQAGWRWPRLPGHPAQRPNIRRLGSRLTDASGSDSTVRLDAATVARLWTQGHAVLNFHHLDWASQNHLAAAGAGIKQPTPYHRLNLGLPQRGTWWGFGGDRASSQATVSAFRHDPCLWPSCLTNHGIHQPRTHQASTSWTEIRLRKGLGFAAWALKVRPVSVTIQASFHSPFRTPTYRTTPLRRAGMADGSEKGRRHAKGHSAAERLRPAGWFLRWRLRQVWLPGDTSTGLAQSSAATTPNWSQTQPKTIRSSPAINRPVDAVGRGSPTTGRHRRSSSGSSGRRGCAVGRDLWAGGDHEIGTIRRPGRGESASRINFRRRGPSDSSAGDAGASNDVVCAGSTTVTLSGGRGPATSTMSSRSAQAPR